MEYAEEIGDGPKVSYNAIMIKAVAQAVKLHPQVNASTNGGVIQV